MRGLPIKADRALAFLLSVYPGGGWRVIDEFVRGTDGPPHELAAAVGTNAVQPVAHAIFAKRAFE